MARRVNGSASLPVRLFGAVSVGSNGASLGPRDLGGVKPKQLLELLLLDRGRVVSKDRLADHLWGEALPESVPATLETYVSVLRRRLQGGREVITTAPRGYRIAEDRVCVDLDEFDRLSQLGVTGEPADRYVHLTAAVELGREPVLADEPYAEWAIPVRRQYAERHLQALVQLAECALALRLFDESGGYAELARAADPLSERACRAAMLAHYAAGDQARALRVYAELRSNLAEELGVVPTADTSSLHTAILDGHPPDTLLAALSGNAPGIRFAGNGGIRLAFQSFGAGELEILFVPPFLSNLGATWDEPVYATFLRRLASLGRVTIFDKRGSGLSDPVVDWPPPEERNSDVEAVLDAAEVDQAVLFGVCDGGVMCTRFAATHPDRVAGLVLFGVPARLLSCNDFPWGWTEQFHDEFLDAFEAAWSRGAGFEALDPSIAHDPRYRALFARLLRLGASPGAARRLREADRNLDIRDLLPSITAPALVLTREEDPWVKPENSRYLAGHLPDARLGELPGADHEPWLGHTDPVLEAVEAFLAEITTSARPQA